MHAVAAKEDCLEKLSKVARQQAKKPDGPRCCNSKQLQSQFNIWHGRLVVRLSSANYCSDLFNNWFTISLPPTRHATGVFTYTLNSYTDDSQKLQSFVKTTGCARKKMSKELYSINCCNNIKLKRSVIQEWLCKRDLLLDITSNPSPSCLVYSYLTPSLRVYPFKFLAKHYGTRSRLCNRRLRHFVIMPPLDRQTNRRTDGQTCQCSYNRLAQLAMRR